MKMSKKKNWRMARWIASRRAKKIWESMMCHATAEYYQVVRDHPEYDDGALDDAWDRIRQPFVEKMAEDDCRHGDPIMRGTLAARWRELRAATRQLTLAGMSKGRAEIYARACMPW